MYSTNHPIAQTPCSFCIGPPENDLFTHERRPDIPLLKLWLALPSGGMGNVLSLQACLFHVCPQLCLYYSPRSPPVPGVVQSHPILPYCCHFDLILMYHVLDHTPNCFSPIILFTSSPTSSCSEAPESEEAYREVGRLSSESPVIKQSLHLVGKACIKPHMTLRHVL